MRGRCYAKIACLGLLIAALWQPVAVSGAGDTKQKPRTAREEPIQIVSDRLDAYNEKRMVVFSGNALATQGGRTIRSDRLTLYYKDDKRSAVRPGGEPEGMGALERVEASGHVTITEGERIVTGETALFDQEAQKITMTGSAVLREGTNVIRGERIVVFLNENRGVVESAENKRVTATIYPDAPQGKKP
jgi:lipopolysaccharide export system protein LptA